MNTKHANIRLLLVCFTLLLCCIEQAQSLVGKPHKDMGGNECMVVRSLEYERLMKTLRGGDLRAFPSRIKDNDHRPIIHQNEHTYKLRLALAITKASFNSYPFDRQSANVENFLKGLEGYLNNLYGRDCGIRFDVIRDNKLILNAEHHKDVYEYSEGTSLISELIGQENFDIGVVIRPQTGGLQGLAILGGVTSQYDKAQARATTDYSTIAHELGHLLGAEHTHERNDGLHLEPGKGQSAMSYGAPRGFFALASIQSIRSTLSVLSYYTDEKRTHLVEGQGGTNKIMRLPFEGEYPKLDRSKLKREYKVPAGTFFQFRIPITNTNGKGFYYAAHPFDRSKSYSQFANLLQPSYPAGQEPLCTFHTRYERPYIGSREEQVYPYSDKYDSGIYTYVLSAFNQGHHDAFMTKLKIVGGPAFRISKVEGVGYTTNTAIAGSDIKVLWEPCKHVYGTDSKVRILLSDDFGVSFKHVLAENVPNNGVWSGAWPYLNINKKTYPNYAGDGTVIGEVRAGVIKVEVVGEAAYALSHYQPYVMRGKELIQTGGFYLKVDDDKSLIFRSRDGNNPPKQYIEVNDVNAVPKMEVLKASTKSSTREVAGQEVKSGNIITRKWFANIGGKKSTYTQIIKIINESSNIPEYSTELSGIEDRVRDLYAHLGQLGYPKQDLPITRKFKTAYLDVYEASGEVKSTTTSKTVQALAQALKEIGDIADSDVVMPSSGCNYKIISYHKTYKGDKHYYLSPNEGRDEHRTTQKQDAATWSLQELDGIYRFTSSGQSLYLYNTSKGRNGVRLVRGFNWGTFAIISEDRTRIAQLDNSGTYLSFGEYSIDPIGTRVNQPGTIVSTDFKFELVDEGFDIYFIAPNWINVSASLVGDNKLGLTTTLVKDNTYKIHIPKGYGLHTIRFDGSNSHVEAQLIGRSAVYNENGKRVYSLMIGESRYSTLYLDFPVTIPSGVRAFTATSEAQGQNERKEYHLKLKPLNAVIPARTAVILYSDVPQNYEFVETDHIATSVVDNVLVGSTETISSNARDDNFHYFDLSKPSSGNPAGKGQTLSYNRLEKGVSIPAYTAYFRLYMYSNDGRDGNYSVRTTKLSTDEFKKKSDKDTPTTPAPSKPEEPKEPKPEPTPAPAPEPPTPPTPPTPDPQPNPPTPVDPPTEPVDPPVSPTPPTPTPPAPTPDPVPPTDPKDGVGDSDVDGSGDEDNTPDPNGSVDGQPNVPIGEDGTIDRPYSARSITSLELGGRVIWLRGRVLGWLTADGRLQSKPTESIALGEDSNTYVPVFIPKAYRMQVQSLSTQALLVEGVLSDYLRGRGISDKGFRSLRAEGIVFAPNATTTDSPEASEVSPYDYTGYIYDLSGCIVGKGNFASLPRGVYILGGKKYIKR